MVTVFLLDLAYAACIAFSPTPIVVVILILFSGNVSTQSRRNALAFLIGWVIGLGILSLIIYWLTRAGLILAEQNPRFPRPILLLLLGLLLLYLARREWRRAPAPGDATELPKWLAHLDDMLSRSGNVVTPRRALTLGVVMSALSPKNIALMLAVSLAIIQAQLREQQEVLLLVIFVLFSSVTIGIPVLYALVKGEGAEITLNQWKIWVVTNTTRMAAVFLVLIGVLLIVTGLADFLGRNISV